MLKFLVCRLPSAISDLKSSHFEASRSCLIYYFFQNSYPENHMEEILTSLKKKNVVISIFTNERRKVRVKLKKKLK